MGPWPLAPAKSEHAEGQIPLGEPVVNLEVHSTAYVFQMVGTCSMGPWMPWWLNTQYASKVWGI